MLWIVMAVIVIVAGLMVMKRRRNYESVEAEPWRASLPEMDEELDMEEIREAEEEWLEEDDWRNSSEDEGWR